jgi:hypothetical protein
MTTIKTVTKNIYIFIYVEESEKEVRVKVPFDMYSLKNFIIIFDSNAIKTIRINKRK